MSLLTRWLPRRFVVVESPFAGDVEGNVAYAQWALLDSITRGETPYASHLLLTQALIDSGRGREVGLLCCQAVPGPRVYYVDRCDLVTRVSPPHLRAKRREQVKQLYWQLGYYAATTCAWAAVLGLVLAGAVDDASLLFTVFSRYTLLPVFVGTLAAMGASSGILQSQTRMRHVWDLIRSGRLLSSGMFAAFMKAPGELRQLQDCHALMWSTLDVGPVAHAMSWGICCPSPAYVEAESELKKGA